MKYLFILLLMAAVAFLFYWRLRPYLRIARKVFGAVREVRRAGVGAAAAGAPPASPPRPSAAGGKLVRCAACGTWLPSERAVTLRSSRSAYCSHACLERSAAAPRAARKSAS